MLKREFEGNVNELAKVAELKKVEQKATTIKEFRRKISVVIRRKLIKVEKSSSIEQWYKHATNLNKHQRESRKKKKKLREKKKSKS